VHINTSGVIAEVPVSVIRGLPCHDHFISGWDWSDTMVVQRGLKILLVGGLAFLRALTTWGNLRDTRSVAGFFLSENLDMRYRVFISLLRLRDGFGGARPAPFEPREKTKEFGRGLFGLHSIVTY
jgi:hypothetical protein